MPSLSHNWQIQGSLQRPNSRITTSDLRQVELAIQPLWKDFNVAQPYAVDTRTLTRK